MLKALTLCLCFVFAFSSANYAYARTVYKSKYASAVLDVETGQLLYSRGADLKRFPASLTKIMTLYILFEELEAKKINLNTRFKVSRRATRQPPSKMGLRAGQRIRVKDLIRGVVTKSGNDSAVVIAENISGTEKRFARRMTRTAQLIGMKNTVFRNASGLPHYRQVSTARDMTLLGSSILKRFPKYYKYFSETTYYYQGRKHRNHNKLLRYYKGTDGIKTGYIRSAGFNLVSSVKRGDKRIIGVVFGGVTANKRDRHMRSLLNKGFRILNHREIRPRDKNETPSYILAHNTNQQLVAKYNALDMNNNTDMIVAENSAKQNIQLGTYRSIKSAELALRKANSILPEKQAQSIKIQSYTQDKSTRYALNTTGFMFTKGVNLTLKNKGFSVKTLQEESVNPLDNRKKETVATIAPETRYSFDNTKKWQIYLGAYASRKVAHKALVQTIKAVPEFNGKQHSIVFENSVKGKASYKVYIKHFTISSALTLCKKGLDINPIPCLPVQ